MIHGLFYLHEGENKATFLRYVDDSEVYLGLNRDIQSYSFFTAQLLDTSMKEDINKCVFKSPFKESDLITHHKNYLFEFLFV